VSNEIIGLQRFQDRKAFNDLRTGLSRGKPRDILVRLILCSDSRLLTSVLDYAATLGICDSVYQQLFETGMWRGCRNTVSNYDDAQLDQGDM